MKRLIILMMILSLTMLAGCDTGPGETVDNGGGEQTSSDEVGAGGEINPTTAADPDASDGENVEFGFTATVTGAVDFELGDSGYFQCEDVGDGELTIAPSFAFSETVLITVPRDATPGTYEFVADSDTMEGASAAFIGADAQTAYYEENVSGSVTLEAVPSAAGEDVRGSFEFTASEDDAADTVTVNGAFDFVAGNNAYANCQ